MEGQEEPEKAYREENFQDKLERFADGIVDSLKYDRLRLWKEVLFHPEKTLAGELGKGTLKRAAKDVFIASLPAQLLGLIGVGLVLMYMGLFGLAMTIASPGVGLAAIAVFIVGAVLVLAVYIAMPVIAWLICATVQHIVAKLLGGVADFTSQSYLIGIGRASVAIVASVLTLFSLIPCIGWIASIISMIVSLYGIYINYKAIRVAHNLGQIPAAIVALTPIVLSIILFGVLFIAFYAGIFTLAAAASQASS